MSIAEEKKMMNGKTVKEKSITDLVMSLTEMNHNMLSIHDSTPYKYYSAVAFYVGQNYDLHVEELRRRGQTTIADKYAPMADGWRR